MQLNSNIEYYFIEISLFSTLTECKGGSDALALDDTSDQRAELDRHFSAGRTSERPCHLGSPESIERRIARLQKGVRAELRCRLAYAGIVPHQSAGDVLLLRPFK